MSYTTAGIDVHKSVLMVVVADVSEAELQFERRRFGATASELVAQSNRAPAGASRISGTPSACCGVR